MKYKLTILALSILLLIGLVYFIPLDQIFAQTTNFEIYVADDSAKCQGRAQCFFNDAADNLNAIALHKAIVFAKENNLEGANIHILSPYQIKSDQVVVDFPVNLIGEDGGWFSTSSTNCSKPMLLITSEVLLSNLNLTDGICVNPSRDLIEINSPLPVTIERSTLEYGKTAIHQRNNLGDLTVRFSELRNNDSYALFSDNTEVNSRMLLVANNFVNNGSAFQVVCRNNSSVDHNYWGEGVLPTGAAQNCGADNKKVLGAKILSTNTGVASTLLSLTSSYPADDFYGFSAKSSANNELYVVNHADQKPFPDFATKTMTNCGNYFDVFLSDNAQAQPITMRFRYDKNDACVQAVQSISLCASGKQGNFPLMWLDPKTSVTDGWDNTGAPPQTEAGNIFNGQETRCDYQNKSIEVVVDNDGRPNLENDLLYTPMTVGFEISAVNSLSPTENVAGIVNIAWGTTSEVNTFGFRIVRSTLEEGPYLQVGATVQAQGGNLTGHIYNLDDISVESLTAYYYKLEVLDTNGQVQQTIGPVHINTGIGNPYPGASPTPTLQPGAPTRTLIPTSTRIPTRTPTQFITATNSFRTARPTNVTQTYTPQPVHTKTPKPTDVEFSKPTFQQSTNTPRPTYSEGEILDKMDTAQGRGGLNWLLPSILIILGALILYFLLARKKR